MHTLFSAVALLCSVRFISYRNKDCEMRVIFSDSKGSQAPCGCHPPMLLTAHRFDWPSCPLCVLALRGNSGTCAIAWLLYCWSPTHTELSTLQCFNISIVPSEWRHDLWKHTRFPIWLVRKVIGLFCSCMLVDPLLGHRLGLHVRGSGNQASKIWQHPFHCLAA